MATMERVIDRHLRFFIASELLTSVIFLHFRRLAEFFYS